MNTIALAFAVSLPAAFASAQDAKLVAITGPVSIIAEGSGRFFKARGGEDLIYGDAIRVGKGGIAHVELGDRGAVLLREESLLTLKGSRRRTELAVAFGEFLVGLRRKLERGHTFKVRTPAALAGVRGTLFWGKASKEDQSTTYAGFGHEIAVTAGGKTVVVAPGATVTVPFGSAPSDPSPSAFGLEYAKNFEIDGSLRELGALAETDKLQK